MSLEEKLTRRNFLHMFKGFLLSSALIQDLNASTTTGLCGGDITKKADYIVDGYVKNKKYRLVKSRNPLDNEVFTDYDFEIERYLKGRPLKDNKMIISTYGGEVGFKNMIYVGDYTKGKQEYILVVLPRKTNTKGYINTPGLTVSMPENKKVRVHLHEFDGKYWVTCGKEGMKILE